MDRELAYRAVADPEASADLWMRQMQRVLSQRKATAREIRRIEAGGCSVRPGRSLPPLEAIAGYHDLGPVPHCVRCGRVYEGTWRGAGQRLHRAHVIDRFLGGLDLEPNLLPLCVLCHTFQPSFGPGDEAAALSWFLPEEYLYPTNMEPPMVEVPRTGVMHV